MVNEAKKFKPGDKWSDDFDYVGMLKYGIQKKMPEQYKLEDLKKLAASMEDVNYHREAGHLFDTIGHLERAGAMARANKSIKGYGDLINKSWKLFRKEVGKTLKSIKEVRLNEELRDDELNTLATNLAYTMPNHTKFDDKKGPTDSQIMKAMKKYFKDLYKYSTTPQKKQAIKIVKKVLSEGKLNEITLKGKDAEGWIKDWGAGGRLNINNMIYKSLGKGKWKGPDGKKLSWKEVAAKASALGDKRVFFEGKLNESQKITDNDIEKMADIAKKHKMKLAKMATHKAVSGNWSYQKMYDELMDDHDGQSYVSDSDRKKFYKAVKKAFPKAKIKEGINEGLNKADVKYAMKMAFDNIPGNWHKALKKVEVLGGGPKGSRIKLNMSSYMGPNKTLQAIVDEFNDIMGMKGYMTGPKPFKINKSSFVKGSITSIILESNDLVFNHGKFGGTGKPWPQTEPNEFAYIDFKKWAKSKEKKIKKQMSILKDDRIFRAMEFVWQTWDKQANDGAFSNIKGNKFGRALVKMMWKDNLVFDKKNHKIITVKESSKLSKIIEGSKIWQQLDKVWKLRDEAMDVETNIIERTKELKQLYMDMEQEAEPGGGPIADKYGKQIEKLEKILKKDRAILKMYMKKIDKLESY